MLYIGGYAWKLAWVRCIKDEFLWKERMLYVTDDD